MKKDNWEHRAHFQRIAMSALGTASFGAALGVGHGGLAMIRGAWSLPALFLGGAALTLPPLYLATALSGGKATPGAVADDVLQSLGSVGTAFLGFAAPAAFFSVTLGGILGNALLIAVILTMGVLGVTAVVRAGLRRDNTDLTPANAIWSIFAMAVGARLMMAIAHASGLLGGG